MAARLLQSKAKQMLKQMPKPYPLLDTDSRLLLTTRITRTHTRTLTHLHRAFWSRIIWLSVSVSLTVSHRMYSNIQRWPVLSISACRLFALNANNTVHCTAVQFTVPAFNRAQIVIMLHFSWLCCCCSLWFLLLLLRWWWWL